MSDPEPKIPLKTKLLYSVGAISPAARQAIFGLYTLYLYTTVMGLPASLVGLATALGLAWEAATGAYVGHLSDRVVGRFWRRHGFMLAGGIALGLTFWAYLSPPTGLATTTLFVWLLVSSLLVRTATSVFMVPYLALGTELARDYHDRSILAWIRGAVTLVGTTVFTSLSFLLFFPESGSAGDPKLAPEGYASMGMAFGLTMIGLTTLASFGTPSRGDPKASSRSSSPWFGSPAVLGNHAFLILSTACALFFIGTVINRILQLHFLTLQAGILDGVALTAIQVALFLGTIGGLLLGRVLARRSEKRAMLAVCSLGLGLTMIGAYLWIGEGRLFGTGNLSAVLGLSFLAGGLASAVLFIPHAMLADIIDQDELATGERKEGLFFGMFLLYQKVSSGIALLAGGWLAEHYAGLLAGAAEQPEETALRIGLLYGAAPGLLLVVAGILAIRYPLNRHRVVAIQAQLKALRRH